MIFPFRAYDSHVIAPFLYIYIFFKFPLNEIIGIIITVISNAPFPVIAVEYAAGNINNKLFFFPVFITVNIGPFPFKLLYH
jgi:hypothetical protein